MSIESVEALVIGCGGHARFVISMLRCSRFSIKGLIELDSNYDPSELIMGYPIVGYFDNLSHHLKSGVTHIFIAIGDNTKRERVYKSVSRLGFSLPSLIHSSAFVDESSKIGNGSIIGPNVVIGAEVTIGNNVIVNSAAVVEHQSVVGNNCHIAPNATICGSVNIGNNVLIGANSTIIPNRCLANNIIVGGGAVVIDSYSTIGCVLVGNPTRELKN